MSFLFQPLFLFFVFQNFCFCFNFSQYDIPKKYLTDHKSGDLVLKFIRSGPSDIFWRNITELFQKNITSRCFQSLNEVVRAHQEGRQWAYQSKN